MNISDKYKGTVIIGCSGGADSMCLADLVIKLSKISSEIKPILLYVDHGLRTESEEEGKKVVAFAENSGCKGIIKKVTVSDKGSIEEAARNSRYEAFKEALQEEKADWVFLAHTKSDQAETLIMRLLRGTGVVGLSGIQPVRGKFVRPLLDYDRKEIEAYCKENDLVYVEDPMNRDAKFTRSRVRFKWLPEMREENANINDALGRLSKSASEIRAFLDYSAKKELVTCSQGNCITINKKWNKYPVALAKHMLLLHCIKTTGLSLELKHLDTLLNFSLAPSDGEKILHLPNMVVRKSYSTLAWNPEESKPTNLSWKGHNKRHPIEGDKVQIKGSIKKVYSLYKANKVPKHLRKVAWLFENKEGQIVWVEHIGRTDFYREC